MIFSSYQTPSRSSLHIAQSAAVYLVSQRAQEDLDYEQIMQSDYISRDGWCRAEAPTRCSWRDWDTSRHGVRSRRAMDAMMRTRSPAYSIPL
jgi:hypothetical protein